MRLYSIGLVTVAIGVVSSRASAQGCIVFDPGSTTVGAYQPIDNHQRAAWIACGTIGLTSVGTGLFQAAFPAGWNNLKGWELKSDGFVQRFGRRELNVTVSNAVEGGISGLWGEEPRYVRASEGSWRPGSVMRFCRPLPPNVTTVTSLQLGVDMVAI
jgi:hypothetical protein